MLNIGLLFMFLSSLMFTVLPNIGFFSVLVLSISTAAGLWTTLFIQKKKYIGSNRKTDKLNPLENLQITRVTSPGKTINFGYICLINLGRRSEDEAKYSEDPLKRTGLMSKSPSKSDPLFDFPE